MNKQMTRILEADNHIFALCHSHPEISKFKKYPPPLTGYIFCLSLPSLLSSSQLTRGIASKIRQINEEFEQPGGRERQKKLRNSKLSSTTFW